MGNTLARVCAASGVAIVLGLAARAAPASAETQATDNQTAMAIPHLVAPGVVSDVVLPQPLAPSDAERVRVIFRDQAEGKTADADRQIEQLDDKLLLGSILADRYLGQHHRSTAEELLSWLHNFGTQPETAAIHALLIKRLPRGTPAPAVPDTAYLAPATSTEAVPEFTGDDAPGLACPSLPGREVAIRVQTKRFTAALHLIGSTSGLTPQCGALLRAEVARDLFFDGSYTEAAKVAEAAWQAPKPEDRVALAAFVAGLSEWRAGNFSDASTFFVNAATSDGAANAAMRAAGAYWAARAALRLRDPDAADRWLKRAAGEDATFYGLIARRFLGWPVGLIPGPQMLSQADVDALAARPNGRRAFALLQVGQISRAEQELRYLWPGVKDDAALRRALLLVAQRAGLTRLAADVTSAIQDAEGIPNEDFRFAVPRLRPDGGFRLNPSLVYGMTRAESNFDSKAVSAAGALGLMQLMPATAQSVAGNHILTDRKLQDPGYNLKLGQQLLESLAKDEHVNDNLIALLASYNAGVGSYASWSEQIRTDDPLLFIEAIPITETRRFVQRALTYTWLYAARLGVTAPSLDAIVAGAFPRFRSADKEGTVLVSLH